MNQVASETRPRTDWHATDAPSVVAALESDAEGLSTNQAQARLAIVGPNRLPAAPAPSWWRIALRQFKSPLIYILAVAAALSLSLNHVTDAAFIVGVLVLNALIGGFQEWKAERSSRACSNCCGSTPR